MRALWSCLWLSVVAIGCNNLEKGKCLEACKVDLQSASVACEVVDDPPACKKQAADTNAACTKKCDAP